MAGGEAAQRINTYVFTDLVGSTRLTRTLPAPVYRRLKDRHDELVRECAAAAGGQVVKALGDGFLVVFSAEEPAVRFAVAVQRAVHAEPWSDGITPEIRIGMDTGPALYRSDPPDFEGDAVNVASHICSRARPGEILLSARSYHGLRPRLDRGDAEVRLEPVGEVRLKGLPAPEPLCRAWAPGLREGFPPLTRAGNLAAFLRPPPFIDREKVLEEIIQELGRRPVVTLLGPGGMGKTRLATEVGARLEASYPAGVWMAPLEAVHQGDAVPAELLAALGLQAEAADPEEALIRHLDNWQGLLILDNVEQLAEEEAGLPRLVSTIARRCAGPRLLCTSRIDMHLGDTVEARIELPALPAPALSDPVERLPDYPSAQLCVERLRLRARQFTLDDRTAPYVAAICRATEGVPLLIELAAGQLGRRTLPEIARDVERALADPSRDADRPDRHRDLTRLLDWSVDLLGEEREFFLRLGVFHGGFDVEAAEALTGQADATELIQRLVDAHLVTGSAIEDFLAERPRYRLLSATAAYCRARLGEELIAWRVRHAAHYASMAGSAGQELFGPSPRAAVTRLKEERENLAAALETALELREIDLAATIGEPLWELLHRLGLWPLVRSGAQRLLEQSQIAPPRSETSSQSEEPLPYCAEAVARMALAQTAHDEGRMSDACDQYRQVIGLWQRLDDPAGVARALHGLGSAFRRQDLEQAERYLRESLELASKLGDHPLLALNRMMLGLIASQQGRLEEAEGLLAEAVRLFRQWDDPWGQAIALNSRAQNLEALGRPLQARDLYAESLELKRELEDRRGTAITLLALGRLAPLVGEPEAAERLLLESLALNRELGDAWGCAAVLGSLAERRLAQQEAGQAIEMAAAARQTLETLGGGASREAAQIDALLQSARSLLPADQAEARERRGRETPILRACDAILRAPPI